MADPAVKKYYDYAQQQVDEQAILDKYNAATVAQFNVQREQNRQAENQFYNEMYNTQKTAMDTIRQSNAAAVASGASRGVQAAQELSSLLGLQQESVASATELAQANRQTAQEETAAVLENVLNAYKQATDERGQLVSRAIEAAQVEATKEQTAATVQSERARLLTEAAENGTGTYLTALQQSGISYADGNVTTESKNSLQVALNGIGKTKDGAALSFTASDWDDSGSGIAKATTISSNLDSIFSAYGIDATKYTEDIAALRTLAAKSDVDWFSPGYQRGDVGKAMSKLGVDDLGFLEGMFNGKGVWARVTQEAYQNLINKIQTEYASGANIKSKK